MPLGVVDFSNYNSSATAAGESISTQSDFLGTKLFNLLSRFRKLFDAPG